MKKIGFAVMIMILSVAVYGISREDRAFDEAENRFMSHDYSFALERYNAFIEEYPESRYIPDAQFRKAVCLYNLGRIDEAASLFTKVETRYASTSYRDSIPFWKGLINYQKQDYETTLTLLKAYLDSSERIFRREALLYQAFCENLTGDTAAAIISMNAYVLESGYASESMYPYAFLASLYLQEKQYENVLDLKSRIEQPSGKQIWIDKLILYYAEALYALGRYEDAQLQYESLLESDKDTMASAYQRLFALAFLQGTEEDITSILHQAERHLAGQQDVLISLWSKIGAAYYEDGKTELAKSYFQRIWGLRTQNDIEILVPLYLGSIYEEEKNYSRAVELYEEYFLLTGREDELILFRYGSTLTEMGNWEEAKTVLFRFISDFPESDYIAQASYLRAYIHYKQADFSPALSIVNNLIKSTRGSNLLPKLLKLKSVLHRELRDIPEAVLSLEEYVPLVPSDLTARIDLIKAYFTQKKYSLVLQKSRELLEGDGTLSGTERLTLHYLRGLSLVAEKQYTEGRAELSKITDSSSIPQEFIVVVPYSYFYKGWAYYREADYSDALTVFTSMIERFPEHELSMQASYLAGWSAYTVGDFGSAQNYFAAYAQSSSDDGRGLFMYGKTLSALKKYNEAAIVFSSIYKDTESPFADDAMFDHARLLSEVGNTENAAKLFLSLAETYPDSSLSREGLYSRGELYFNNGNYSKARDAFYLYRVKFPRGQLFDASLYWGGLAAYEEGEKFGALLLWEKLIKDYPGSAYRFDALIKGAVIQESAGNYTRALEMYSIILSQYPEESMKMAVDLEIEKLQFLILGQTDEEAELSAAIAKKGGLDTEEGRAAMLDLSRLYIFEGGTEDKYDHALTMLESIVETVDDNPNDAAMAQFLIGELYYRAGKMGLAGNAFLKAATLQPDNQDLLAMSMYKAAEIAILSGQREEAKIMIHRIETNFPDSEWVEAGKKLLEEQGKGKNNE